MSVGYIDGSEEYRNLKWLPRKIRRPMLKAEGEEAEESPVIVPAASLFQADTSLPGQPLRIRVHGLYPPIALDRKRRREVPLAIDLEAIFPSPDPADPAPLRFFVWSLRQKPGWNPSPPVSFRFPVDWQTLPQFVLRVRGQGVSTRCCGRSSPSTIRRASRSCGGASTSWGSIPSPGMGGQGLRFCPRGSCRDVLGDDLDGPRTGNGTGQDMDPRITLRPIGPDDMDSPPPGLPQHP